LLPSRHRHIGVVISVMQNPILRFALPALLALAGCATTPQAAWKAPTLHHRQPILIAHRGASGLRPEHTLAGYKLALEEGADCIEPDLVMTSDHVLVARHDTYLSATTDVADHPEFASRKHLSKDPEFPDRVDWWVADFTLAELKTLRAKQAFRGRSKEFDGQFQIPTFEEVLQLATTSKTRSGHAVCVYPEAKSPAYHASLGMDLAGPILDTLKKYHLDKKGSPIFIQCFEPAFLKAIRPRTQLPLIMLVADKAGLDAANAYPGAPFWDGIGGTHQLVLNKDGSSTGVLEAAHARGQAVHLWTYRDDAPVYGQPVETSERQALALGIDGFFTDFPATGRKSIDGFAARK
jgi:glycerophosphoryl diester phosphodiesterase